MPRTQKWFKISWQSMERGSHNGNHIFSRSAGATPILATSASAAKAEFKQRFHTAPRAGIGTWRKILAAVEWANYDVGSK